MTAREWLNRAGVGRLSPRDRRAIRLGLLVLLPALLWVGVVRPWRRSLDETRDRLETERGLLARERALIAAAASLPDALRKAGADAEATRSRMIDGIDPALAEEKLTVELERLAAESRVLLQEMRGVEPPRTAAVTPGLQPIRLAVRGQSDMNGVTAFLQRVEEHRLLLRIHELSIQPVIERPANNQRGRSQDPPAPAVPTGVLEFAVIVEAYAAPASISERVASEEAGT